MFEQAKIVQRPRCPERAVQRMLDIQAGAQARACLVEVAAVDGHATEVPLGRGGCRPIAKYAGGGETCLDVLPRSSVVALSKSENAGCEQSGDALRLRFLGCCVRQHALELPPTLAQITAQPPELP